MYIKNIKRGCQTFEKESSITLDKLALLYSEHKINNQAWQI